MQNGKPAKSYTTVLVGLMGYSDYPESAENLHQHQDKVNYAKRKNK